MMRLTVITIFCCLVLSGCIEEDQPHLPRHKMIEVITDIHLAEVYSTMVSDSTHKVTNKNLDSLSFYYKSIMEHHNISMQDFRTSMDWYSAHPEELDSAYVGVMAEISMIEGLIDASSQ